LDAVQRRSKDTSDSECRFDDPGYSWGIPEKHCVGERNGRLNDGEGNGLQRTMEVESKKSIDPAGDQHSHVVSFASRSHQRQHRLALVFATTETCLNSSAFSALLLLSRALAFGRIHAPRSTSPRCIFTARIDPFLSREPPKRRPRVQRKSLLSSL
jgi:hypothetical protein